MDTILFLIYLDAVFNSAGLLINILVIVVLCRPQVRRKSVDVYLLGLGLSDFGRLVTSLFYDISYLKNVPWPGGLCPSMQWLRLWLGCSSSWVIVVFTAERLYVTYYPMKKTSCTRRKAMAITAAVFFTIFFMNMYIFKYQTLKPTRFLECMGNNPIFKKALIAFEMAAYSILPGILISISNFSIGAVLYNRHNVSLLEFARRNLRSAESHKMFGMLVVNGVTFIILTLPETLLDLFRRTNPERQNAQHELENMLAALFFLMTNLNHGINPLIYTLVGARYRDELLDILRCKWRRSKTAVGASVVKSGGRSVSSRHACSLGGHRKAGLSGGDRLGVGGTSDQCSRSGVLASISEGFRSCDEDFRSTKDVRRKSPVARRKGSLVGPTVSLIVAGGSDRESSGEESEPIAAVGILAVPSPRPPPVPLRPIPLYSNKSLPMVHHMKRPMKKSNFNMLL